MKTHLRRSTPSMERKGFSAALDYFLSDCCPSLRGDLIRKPVVAEICKLVDKYYPPVERMRMGQVLWYAVAADDRGCGKRLEQCRLQPVVIDAIHESDIQDILNGIARGERNRKIAVRLFKQAYDQSGVMSCADVGSIMGLSGSTVAHYVRTHEKQTGEVVPRRGTIHDLGRSMTHKKVICRKHLMEGKSIEQTARDTNHSPGSVARYTNDFKRVRECLKAGWSVEKTAYTTGMSKSVTSEYFEMMEIGDDLPF